MNQESNKTKGFNYLRSKREICRACEQQKLCILPCRDTEDEDTSLYNCPKYKVGIESVQKS